MRAKYNRADDALLLEIEPPGSTTIEHAEEVGPLIVHYSPEGRVVLIDILDASAFLEKLMQAKNGATVEL